MNETAAAPRVAVIVPCYRETGHVLDVLQAIGPEVRSIFVVDDACPDGSGALVEDKCSDPRVSVLTHDTNQGVGGATLTGYRAALDAGCEILVKVDGDGQMDPANITKLIDPVLKGEADYAKGNRFHRLDAVTAMPKTRIFGNVMLSLASKLSSGYWNIFDPTNGFTALHEDAARRLPLDQISKGYFFESDMLFHLGLIGAVVRDVPMRAIYGAETSGIRIPRIVPEFLFKHYRNACRRIFQTYFVVTPGWTTLQLVLGKLLLLFGLAFGIYKWHESSTTGVPATAGTVLLAALPVIIGTQFLISFINTDTRNVPATPIQGSGTDITQ